MEKKIIEGQIAIHKDPRKLQDSYIPEVIEQVLTALLTGEKPEKIAKDLSIPLAQIEEFREKYSLQALHDVRLWHSLAFIEETWKIIFLALQQVKKEIPDSSAKESADILSKLFDKQSIARQELEFNITPELEFSRDELAEKIREIEEKLKREGVLEIEEAEFKEEKK